MSLRGVKRRSNPNTFLDCHAPLAMTSELGDKAQKQNVGVDLKSTPT